AREEGGEMPEAYAHQAAGAAECTERTCIERTDPVNQDFVELARLAPAHDREGQHVPEWEAEIVDEDLAPRLRVPFGRIHCGEQLIDLVGRGVEVDLFGQH